ncbi:hypothetical protein [Prosthecobacter sp.]|uniref:hypothetical protein n=1 Tax=Prosthecobacter sp. TaxID=1965333 RepID=UPI0025DD188F|nr:hypothetical protein [Prosthecobacter sp.]
MPLFCCGHCAQSIDADDALAGTEVGCPGCHAVIQVPACARHEPYQPYQPPAFSQTQATSHAGHSDPWLLRAPLLGTGAAFVLCFVKKLVEPVSSLDAAMGNVGPVMTFAGAIGYTLAAGIFALVAALVIAGIAAARRKPFSSTLARSYGFAVVAFALLMMAGALLQPRSFAGAPSSAPTSPSSSQVTENTRQELNKLQADIEKMQQGEAPGIDAAPAKPPTTPAEPPDDLGKFLLISRQYFEEVAALQKAYTDDIAKIGFLRVLDGERILKDTDSSEAYDLLARARVLLKKYGARMREAVASLPAKVRASNISAAAREGHARSAEKGVAEALKTFDENWALEASAVDEIQTIIDLLGRRRGKWRMSKGLFIFDDEGDLAAFNASMAKITAVVARQNEIKEQGQRNTGKMFDDLRTALPK